MLAVALIQTGGITKLCARPRSAFLIVHGSFPICVRAARFSSIAKSDHFLPKSETPEYCSPQNQNRTLRYSEISLPYLSPSRQTPLEVIPEVAQHGPPQHA
jgi:hypothetical protein